MYFLISCILIGALCPTPILRLPNFTKPFVVDADALYQVVGALWL